MEEISLLNNLGPLLIDFFKNNKKLVLLSADLAKSNQVYIIKEKFPKRFFQMGIAEQDMAGTAVGLSFEGFIPIISSYTAYVIPRAYEQLRNHIGIDNENIKILGTHSSFTCYNPGDRSYEDLALAKSIDNLEILVPSDYTELQKCLKFMIEHNGGCYLRLPQYSFKIKNHPKIKNNIKIPNQIKKGNKIAIFSYGINIKECIIASKNLNNSIYSFPLLTNLNENILKEIISKYKNILIVEDHKKIGSLYSDILEIINKYKLKTKINFLGIPDNYHQFGNYLKIQNELELNSEGINKHLLNIMKNE